MKITKTNLDLMYKTESDLYHRILGLYLLKNIGPDLFEFDENKIGAAFQPFLNDFIRRNNIQEPAAPAPTPASTPADDLARLQKQQREQEEANAKAITEAANKRLTYYIQEQGLLENDDHNVALLKNWFDRNNVPFTSYNLDRAVEELASELFWAVWSPRLQPVEEVRTLANGEPELPLNASADEIRRASKAQVDDLSRRKGEFTSHRRGSFGASFIKPTI